MAAQLTPVFRRFSHSMTISLPLLLHAVAAQAAAAQTRPVSPIIQSARTVSSLVQLLILAIFLILFFIFMVSVLVAVRRMILARRRTGHEKTTHIDAWTLAGQRLKTDAEDKTTEDPDDQTR